MPAVKVRLMLDGAIDGYEPYEDAIAAQPATPLDEERVEGQDMLYSSGTTGRPKGVKVPAARTRRSARAPTASPGWPQLLFGADESTVYLSPAPAVPRRAAALLPSGRTGSAAPSS